MVDPLPSQSIQQQRTPASSVPQSNYYHHPPQRQQYPSFVNHPQQQEQRTGGPYRQFPTPASASSSSSRSTSNVSIRGESALPPPTITQHDYRFPVPKYVYGLEHLQIRPSAGCTCKKSRCLKLYCQCFSSSTVCGEHCKCGDCRNTELFGKDIEMARRIILQRNPLAFRKRQGSWRPNNNSIRPPQAALIVTPPHYQRPLIGGISQQQQHHPSYMTYYDYQQQQQQQPQQPQNYRSSPPPPPLVSPRKATTTTAPCTTPRPKETDAMIAAIAMTQLGTHHPKAEDTRNTKLRTTTTTTLPTTRLLPKGISFRKICSRCGRSRSDHADAGFGNACTFDTCGKCGKQSHDTMGVQCQYATPEQQAHYDH